MELFEVWSKIQFKCILTNREVVSTEPNEETVTHEQQLPPDLQIDHTEEVSTVAEENKNGDADNEQIPVETTPLISVTNGITANNSAVITEPESSKPSTSTPKRVINKAQSISPAFANHISWPTESPVKNRKKREKLPFATTSKQWIEFNRKKGDEKLEKERAKLARQKAALFRREQKAKTVRTLFTNKTCKASINKRKHQDTSDSESEEWEESGDSLDDVSLPHTSSEDEDETITRGTRDNDMPLEGDFVLASFPGQKSSTYQFICIVQKLLENKELEVMALKNCDESDTLFKTDEDDISVVSKKQIVRVLPMPTVRAGKAGDRLRYQFKQPIKTGRCS